MPHIDWYKICRALQYLVPMADDEQRNLSQICEMLLYEEVEAYKKDGPKFIQRLVAKQKLRTKSEIL